jgi:hypothetical protein
MKLPPQVRTLMAIKPHKYGTRHLTAGEEYEVPSKHAVALVAARKAKFAEDKKSARSPEKPAVEPVVPRFEPEPETFEANIDSLRLQATQLGINVDGRWGVARLQHEIDQAKR